MVRKILGAVMAISTSGTVGDPIMMGSWHRSEISFPDDLRQTQQVLALSIERDGE
jgi:non-ribosomal peptide synthetase component F